MLICNCSDRCGSTTCSCRIPHEHCLFPSGPCSVYGGKHTMCLPIKDGPKKNEQLKLFKEEG